MNSETRKKKRMKKQLVEISDGTCYLCEGPLNLEAAALDHWFPKSRGGPTELWNLRLVHKKCNSKKTDTITFEALKAFVENKKDNRAFAGTVAELKEILDNFNPETKVHVFFQRRRN